MGVLLLVRHGQASFGAEDYDVLSELGFVQAARTGEALAAESVAPRRVVHGAMRRQRETAESMARAAGWDVGIEVDPRWDEFDHLDVVAAYDGLPRGTGTRDLDRRAFQEVFEKATARWTSGEDADATGDGDYAETFAGFVARIEAALRETAGSLGSGETAVVVTSGGVIAVVGALLTLVPREPSEMATGWQRLNTVLVNASVTRILVGGSGVRLLTFNEHAFLDREQVTYR